MPTFRLTLLLFPEVLATPSWSGWVRFRADLVFGPTKLCARPNNVETIKTSIH